jgi:hypothetical protein
MTVTRRSLLTFVSGWQEGAVIAAHHAVTNIDRQVRGTP